MKSNGIISKSSFQLDTYLEMTANSKRTRSWLRQGSEVPPMKIGPPKYLAPPPRFLILLGPPTSEDLSISETEKFKITLGP